MTQGGKKMEEIRKTSCIKRVISMLPCCSDDSGECSDKFTDGLRWEQSTEIRW